MMKGPVPMVAVAMFGFRVFARVLAVAALTETVLLIGGCVFVGALFGPKVLEKSKEQTPPWVSVKPSQLLLQESGFQFHAVQLDEMDLPLGVKKAQLGATQLSELAIIGAARIKVRGVCKLKPDSGKGSPAERIEAAVASAVKKQFGAAVRLADIYYEKVESPESGEEKIVRAGYVYNIHVLVTFPREQFEAALADAAKTMRRESGVESRRCGDDLAANLKQPASR